MMNESYYQKRIMDAIEAEGGHVVNGKYTKNGEADLQAGWPIEAKLGENWPPKVLVHLCIEVKTPKDYIRVISALDEVEGEYRIIDAKKLKKHEPLQVTKINSVRRKGGLACFASTFEQVKSYIEKSGMV